MRRDSNQPPQKTDGNPTGLFSEGLLNASGSEGSFTLPTQGQGHQHSKSSPATTERRPQLHRSKTTTHQPPLSSLSSQQPPPSAHSGLKLLRTANASASQWTLQKAVSRLTPYVVYELENFITIMQTSQGRDKIFAIIQ